MMMVQTPSRPQRTAAGCKRGAPRPLGRKSSWRTKARAQPRGASHRSSGSCPWVSSSCLTSQSHSIARTVPNLQCFIQVQAVLSWQRLATLSQISSSPILQGEAIFLQSILMLDIGVACRGSSTTACVQAHCSSSCSASGRAHVPRG